MTHCAGVILFGYDSKIRIYVPLVRTPRGNWSFPKGNLKKDETIFEGGYRELFEETGIEKDDFDVIDDGDIHIEMSDKGNPATSYFVGEYKHKINPSKLELTPCDPDELSLAQWVPYDDIINWDEEKMGGRIKQRRINILTSLVDRLLKLC